jgi:outer membrane protein assembly factor BamB
VTSRLVVAGGLLAALLWLAPCSNSNHGGAVDDAGTGATGGSAGGTGTGGNAGSMGAGSSVLERNNHPSRDALFVEPTLTRSAVARMAFDRNFNATFTGIMYASLLYLENGPQGKGVFFAVTTGNDVYALDETTGAVVWTHSIGPAPQASGAGCGSIHPIGIISTPVIDAQARTIFIAGAVGSATIDRHEIHALSVDDGSERSGWPVDVGQLSYGPLKFMPQPENQRSALSLVGGIVYVAYGGHVGDCGPYHGWVVAVDSKDPSKTGAWATGGQGEGIWAAGGMASDGTGVFAVTGNATAGVGFHRDSEEVVHLTGLATLDRSTVKNHYYPAAWAAMDAADLDFGSNSPVYVEVPGATPSSMIAAVSKNGHLFLLDNKNLGGLNGHVVDYTIPAGAVAAHGPLAAYTTPLGGVHIVFPVGGGVPCPTTPGPGLVSIGLSAGAPPQPYLAWCVPTLNRNGAMITTVDGKVDTIVWHLDNTRLMANDGDNGAVLYQDTADACLNVMPWTTPIAVKGRVFIGAAGHLCSWSVRPPAPADAAAGN